MHAPLASWSNHAHAPAPRSRHQHVLLYNVKGVTYNDYLQACGAARPACSLRPAADARTHRGPAQPLEKAEMVREGTHCTILTYSRMRCVGPRPSGGVPRLRIVLRPALWRAATSWSRRSRRLWRRAMTRRSST
jgi:hypothetical protein